ncbi:hypothetical protein S7335_3521 [Synechococcus sp. PCC 7335]|uniref:sulfotransferase n=1 Tax=Synechococcus sp. (strain ATCC 29403 / PCC 7335) TaxID=91464 RepID=UPI00017EE425|nr:sulfotransferase [Synechococcus sp. PCC 7335]EDX85818.1 hypothetical protein S7335_3521 [Synechococcus sp. PCC 7335]
MTAMSNPTPKLSQIRRNLGYQIGMLGFPRLRNLLRVAHYTVGIHPKYLLRLLWMITSSFVSWPLRLAEKLFYGRKIAQTQIKHSPIFMIGHWRSGTTYLHNLMTQAPRFGYFSMYQAIAPDCSLIGHQWLRQLQ